MAVVAAWYVVKLCRQHGHVRDSQRKRRQHGGLMHGAVALLHDKMQLADMAVKD